ncbi:MAG: AhpC/TSA family protein [Microscillaceae bacterium]|nr:AhpC/TSA family protein [Microscillaceae bacterium]
MNPLLKSIYLLPLLAFTLSLENPLPKKAEDIQPLLTGEAFPKAQVQDLSGKVLDLQALIKQKPTVLIVYRGGWCPYCNTQLAGTGAIIPSLQEMGYQVLALSPDSSEKLRAEAEDKRTAYTLLSDPQLEAAEALGIIFEMPAETAERYASRGLHLPRLDRYQAYALPVPTVLVLDQEGLIQFEYINPNYKVRLQPELLLKAAELALKP